MNKRAFNKCYVLLLLLLSACGQHSTHESSQENPGAAEIYSVTASGTEATNPYLTRDHRGNPVLCWTEKQVSDNRYILKYAVFDTATAAFTAALRVPPSLGTKTSAESANKIAFKSDGTIVALFGKQFQDPRNPFASAIQYCLSSDQGISWSAPRYLHSDTLHHYGRGFFDAATLPDGEVAAIWLDGRYGEADTGSALFFARTIPGGGFGMDKMIGQSTCECCRTDMLVDSAGIIHLAYRDILYPRDRMGKQVRDMVYSRSRDNGRSFLPPTRISADNWKVEGCPHSGPSLAAGADGIQAVWFTAGSGTAPSTGGPGVYQAAWTTATGQFGDRALLNAEARHPQLIALPSGGTAIAWDEIITSKENGGQGVPAQTNHDVHARHDAHTEHDAHVQAEQGSSARKAGQEPAGAPAIVLQLNFGNGEQEKILVAAGGAAAHHPVLTALAPGKLLLAWVQETNGISGIKYCLIDY